MHSPIPKRTSYVSIPRSRESGIPSSNQGISIAALHFEEFLMSEKSEKSEFIQAKDYVDSQGYWITPEREIKRMGNYGGGTSRLSRPPVTVQTQSGSAFIRRSLP